MIRVVWEKGSMESADIALVFKKSYDAYLLASCNTEERIAQNIYIHNSNGNYKN